MNFFEAKSGNGTSVVPTPNAEGEFPRGVSMEAIANFRTLGGLPIENSNRVIKQKMIYRSAAPTYASETDKCYLLDKLDIMTLIDFRTTYETKNLNFGRRKYEDNFLSFSVKKECPSADVDKIDRSKEELLMEDFSCYSAIRKIYKGTPRLGERRKSSLGIIRKRYNLPLINDPYFMDGVYPNAPPAVKLKCKAARVLLPQGSEKVSAYFLLKHLNDLGLFEMYRLTLEFTRREILTVFRILKCMDNYPVSIFCSLGKDRTGIITGLLLSCLGVPRDVIVDDYHETEIHLEPSLDSISNYFNRIGLTNEEFVRAPKEVMIRLLEYLDNTYGSTSAYLENIGFSLEEQKLLFEVLTEEKNGANTPAASPATM
jgi:protein tyrosine/serine phosphatase